MKDASERTGLSRLPFVSLMLLAIVLLLSLSRAALRTRWKAVLYSQAIAAAERGHWETAFSDFYQLYQLDPHFRDVSARLIDCARSAVISPQDSFSIENEIKLLRWLVAVKELNLLGSALDGSVVSIPAGEFRMGDEVGDSNERPQRVIYLDAYQLDRYEVTNVQYQRFIVQTGRRTPRYWSGTDFPAGQADVPVVGVGWEDARAYCAWVGKRLPSEAQWEKACRGAQGYRYPWGDNWEASLANTGLEYAGDWPMSIEDGWQLLLTPAAGVPVLGLKPVGSYPDGASEFGVLDLVGNASEWVADWYDPAFYASMPAKNPVSSGPPWSRSLRGSGWYGLFGQQGYVERECRCSARNASHSYDTAWIGFRCAGNGP
jgi:formylglycine-generating enzyme required for sulfatase activity